MTNPHETPSREPSNESDQKNSADVDPNKSTTQDPPQPNAVQSGPLDLADEGAVPLTADSLPEEHAPDTQDAGSTHVPVDPVSVDYTPQSPHTEDVAGADPAWS